MKTGREGSRPDAHEGRNGSSFERPISHDGTMAEPRVGGDPHGLPDRLDGRVLPSSRGPDASFPGWPSGRDEPQRAYEPPRTTNDPVGRRARLRMLGNACVSQQAEAAFRILASRALG